MSAFGSVEKRPFPWKSATQEASFLLGTIIVVVVVAVVAIVVVKNKFYIDLYT